MSNYILIGGAVAVVWSFYALFRSRRSKNRPGADNNWTNEDYARFQRDDKPRSTDHDFSDGGYG